jgi:hypothetical protein
MEVSKQTHDRLLHQIMIQMYKAADFVEIFKNEFQVDISLWPLHVPSHHLESACLRSPHYYLSKLLMSNSKYIG